MIIQFDITFTNLLALTRHINCGVTWTHMSVTWWGRGGSMQYPLSCFNIGMVEYCQVSLESIPLWVGEGGSVVTHSHVLCGRFHTINSVNPTKKMTSPTNNPHDEFSDAPPPTHQHLLQGTVPRRRLSPNRRWNGLMRQVRQRLRRTWTRSRSTALSSESLLTLRCTFCCR